MLLNKQEASLTFSQVKRDAEGWLTIPLSLCYGVTVRNIYANGFSQAALVAFAHTVSPSELH